MTRFGLTGGVGAGKSLVAERLKEHSIAVLDLDDIGRELTSDRSPDVIRKMQMILGPGIVVQGKLDRKKVREIIFRDSIKREKIEELLHPLILSEFNRQSAALRQNLVICEAALLVESGFYHDLDGLIVVTADENIRLNRLVERDGLDVPLAQDMIASQIPEKDKVSVATYVLKNNGTRDDLRTAVDKLLDVWKVDRIIS
jgi:dephospho-CoA kinase